MNVSMRARPSVGGRPGALLPDYNPALATGTESGEPCGTC